MTNWKIVVKGAQVHLKMQKVSFQEEKIEINEIKNFYFWLNISWKKILDYLNINRWKWVNVVENCLIHYN